MAILKKLYGIIYMDLPLFKASFQVLIPKSLVGHENFISYI